MEGTLTPEHSFGRGPLESNEELKSLQEHDIYQCFPSMEAVFQSTLHSDGFLMPYTILFTSRSLFRNLFEIENTCM